MSHRSTLRRHGFDSQGLPTLDRGGGTGNKEGRGEACRDQPEVILQRLGNASRNAEGAIEQGEDADPDHGCQGEMDESTPPPPQDQDHDNERDREDGKELGDGDGQLTYRDWDEGHDVGEVVAKAGVGPFGQLDEQQQHERDESPDDKVDHVARVAEVALARRAVVEGCCRARRRRGRRRRRSLEDSLAHVVPSRATAATTRNTSTAPMSRPP